MIQERDENLAVCNEKILKLIHLLSSIQMKVSEISAQVVEEGKECVGVVNCGLKFLARVIDQAADMLTV